MELIHLPRCWECGRSVYFIINSFITPKTARRDGWRKIEEIWNEGERRCKTFLPLTEKWAKSQTVKVYLNCCSPSLSRFRLDGHKSLGKTFARANLCPIFASMLLRSLIYFLYEVGSLPMLKANYPRIMYLRYLRPKCVSCQKTLLVNISQDGSVRWLGGQSGHSEICAVSHFPVWKFEETDLELRGGKMTTIIL